MSGKGHAPRPFSVDGDTYANNYCLTFGHRPRGDGQCKHCGAKAEASLKGNPDGQAERVQPDDR